MMVGWSTVNVAVEEALTKVAATAPDDAAAEDGKAYVSRIATAALSTAFLGHRLTSHGLVMPLPVQGGPNPDYIMRHTMIAPERTYRLTGWMNGSERAGVGLYTIGKDGAPQLSAYTNLEKADCDSDGGFSLEISATANGPNALASVPDARLLIIRALHRDNAEPAHFALAGNDPAVGPALAGGSNETALVFAANQIRNTVSHYMAWIKAARELPNRLASGPDELGDTVIGDPGTQYFLGGFDLAEGEWLEIVMPPGLSGYWSLHAYNFWYEHLGTPGAHDRNAKCEPDGSVRIAVGGNAPEDMPNLIDTLGRKRGALICRVTGGETPTDAPQAFLRRNPDR